MTTKKQEKSKVTPVYLRSTENVWIPALQLKTHDGKATVAVPKFKDEENHAELRQGIQDFQVPW